MSTQLCLGRPSDWWDVGDGGNRLATAICRVCAGCPNSDPDPAGVIREGVAYSDRGAVIPECPTCGRPSDTWRGGVVTRCSTCAVDESLPLPDTRLLDRRWILSLMRRGFTDEQVSAECGRTVSAVQNIRYRYGPNSKYAVRHTADQAA